MILYYKSSNGQEFNLKVGHLRMRTADFHTYGWTPQAVSQQFGERPYRFDKSAITYSAQLSVFGTMDERRQYLNLLHAAFDHDIYSMTPGKIIHGEYEIDCYITMSSTHFENPFIYNDLNIYCPYPAWKRERKYELKYTENEKNEYPYLDYMYGYMYDYKATLPGYAQLVNGGEAPANYKLVIYGAAANPVVYIDGVPVGITGYLTETERVEISSINKTVMIYGAVNRNAFNQRIKSDKSIFDRIPAGAHEVAWNGAFDADLYLYEERSEPLWI